MDEQNNLQSTANSVKGLIEKAKKPLTDEEIVASNEKWFKFFVYLPKILVITFACLFFIWSIVDPAVFYYGGRYYGVMRIGSFFGAMMIWWLIGAAFCGIVWVVTKLAVSYKILHIYYLKNIKNSCEK